MRHRRKLAPILWLIAGLSLAAAPATADSDHNEIRRLRQAKRILALDTIIANHRRDYPGGKLLEAELEFERGHYVYELMILEENGVVREFEYDATSGELWRLHSAKEHD